MVATYKWHDFAQAAPTVNGSGQWSLGGSFTPDTGWSLQRVIFQGGIYGWSNDSGTAEGNPIYGGALVRGAINLLDNDRLSHTLWERDMIVTPVSQSRVFLASVTRLGLWSVPWDFGLADIDVRLRQETGLVKISFGLHIEPLRNTNADITVDAAGGQASWRILTSIVPGA